jgi:E3 ubiquitin-protein ligase UBR4
MPTNSLLKPTLYGPVPDMQPFFARQYIKGLNDIFELYPQVLTEMAVRLPYQILKLTNSNANQQQHTYDSALTFTLCEYMLHMQSPSIRRQVRKLLLYMCGNKERYRKLRDLHSLNEHMKAIRASLNSTGLTYQSLVSLMDHLKACYEIASARTGNWQRFCLLNTDILSSLLSLSCQQLDHEQISTIILQLLQAAVVNTNSTTTPSIQEVAASSTGAQVKTKERKDRDKSEELDNLGTETKFDPANCNLLVQQIFNQVTMPNLSLFIKTFLLETNSINIRWLAHGLIYAFYENCNEANKSKLLEVLFALWPMIPGYGKRTPQFIDLIGFFTLNTKSVGHLLPEKISKAVKLLREQNEFVAKHPSASLYTSLGQVLDLDGFYLESEPCLICNSVDQSFNIIKLTSIKMDSKFTTNSNIIKLVNSHIISKIILRIGDLKRTKMVRTINVYYNSRNVQAVVELKNRPSMWHKAKSVTLQSGQTDVSF